jgi:hypothetical protein
MELGIQFPNLLTVLRLAVALECKVTELVRVFDKTDLPAMLEVNWRGPRSGRDRSGPL